MDPKLENELALDRSIPEIFAVEEDVVERRFAQYSGVDAFPDVPAALLSTPDLLDYVAATGMIHPFRINMARQRETLKPATYGVPLLGRFVYWEEASSAGRGKASPPKHAGELAEGAELLLRPNTITYVTLEPYFRLPRYIAARFNLNIRDIYRGILVGTGPLVDPGFEGRLSVPLHNLTSNEYPLVGGEVLVWMEFTKLSQCDGWRPASVAERPPRNGFYVAFPADKKKLMLDDYLRKAHPGPIVSSIPAAIGDAQRAAESAGADARKMRNIGIGGAVVTALTVVLALIAIVVPTWNLINDASTRSDDLSGRVTELERDLQIEKAVNQRQATRIVELQQAAQRRARPR